MAGPRIVWTDAEWEALAEVVFHTRLSDLGAPFMTLVNRAIQTLPKNRQRTLQTIGNVLPLVDRLQSRYHELKEYGREIQSYRDRMAHIQSQSTDPEEILGTLTDKEIMDRYGDKVLDLLTPEEILQAVSPEVLLESMETPELAANAIRRFMEDVMQPVTERIEAPKIVKTVAPIPTNGTIPFQKKRLPRVVVVGCLPAQQHILREKLKESCDLDFASKDSPVPSGADYYFCWTRFISHATESQAKLLAPVGRFYRHSGGLNKLTTKVLKAVKP